MRKKNSQETISQFPLHRAVLEGSLNKIQELLKDDTDINTINNDYKTPLYLAVEQGNVEMAMMLLQHGAKVTTAEGENPLYIAFLKGNETLTNLLLENAKPNTNFGDSLIDPIIENGRIDIINVLPDYGINLDINECLISAVFFKNIELAELFINKGADVNYQFGGEGGTTALHFATSANHLAITKFLIEHGAEINVVDWANDEVSPLYNAVENNNIEIAKLLLDHNADINIECDNITPLQLAIEKRLYDIIELFISKEPLDSSVANSFFEAIADGDLDWVKFLLKCGIDVNLRNSHEQTALHIAAECKQFDIINYLIDMGGDIALKDREGMTAIECAEEEGIFNLIEIINASRVNPQEKVYYETDALIRAINLDNLDYAKKIIADGVDINCQDENDNYPLHHAAEKLDLDFIKLLVTLGADVNVENRFNQTPLHIVASQEDGFNAASLLVLYGAVVDREDNLGKTPFDYAEEQQDYELMDCLRSKKD